MMTKSRRILSRARDVEVQDMVAFQQIDEETELITNSLLISEEDWNEFGCPETITLTIEPGDQLNVPGVYAPGVQVDTMSGRGPAEKPKEALLGLATTKQLIQELEARARVSEINGESWPLYRTVDNG